MALALLCLAIPALAQSSFASEARIEVASDGWRLIGDLNLPVAGNPLPAVLMLNQAAGNRNAYVELARYLADRGIASLRLDLPGHGQSTNLGRFVPGERSRDPMIWEAEAGVVAALEFLQTQQKIDPRRIAVVGASYAGEEAAEAGRLSTYAKAYVLLSPGSLSDESIDRIDTSGARWLFVTSRDEPFLQDIRNAVTARSESVEQLIVPGRGHASNLLAEHPGLAERVAVWLESKLAVGD
jgi:dienelactone hydrolase